MTVVEMLVGILMSGVIVGAGISAVMLQGHVHVQQNRNVEMEQNLRIGMDTLTDNLRGTGYGAPTPLVQWIPWVGLAENPEIGTKEVSLARCTPLAVLSLSGAAAVGTTAIAVQSQVPGESVGDVVDAGAKPGGRHR